MAIELGDTLVQEHNDLKVSSHILNLIEPVI